MPQSSDVRLPIGVRPQFPNRCIVCGGPNPDDVVRVKDSTGWNFVFFTSGEKVVVEAPACFVCAPSFRWRRRGRGAVVWSLIIGGAVLGVWLFESFKMPRRVHNLIVFATIGVCLIPWFVWQSFDPPIFDITASDDHVDYEFRDPDYAAEFARGNGVSLTEE